MSGSEYLLWSYGQFEKMTFFTPDLLALVETTVRVTRRRQGRRWPAIAARYWCLVQIPKTWIQFILANLANFHVAAILAISTYP
jgi:hypothetical protein